MIGALDLQGSQGYLGTRGQAVYRQALSLGAYLRPLGDTVYVAPPLNIPDADLDELLEIVQSSVKTALERG
jgi:adenosylmethionine-8-amino-7-oxononanoate aminotransferase